MRIKLSLKIVPNDLWVGVFWIRSFLCDKGGGEQIRFECTNPSPTELKTVVKEVFEYYAKGYTVTRPLFLWVCPIPCLVLAFQVWRKTYDFADLYSYETNLIVREKRRATLDKAE